MPTLQIKRRGKKSIYAYRRRPLERLRAMPQQIKEKVIKKVEDEKVIVEKRGVGEFIPFTTERAMSVISAPADLGGYRTANRRKLAEYNKMVQVARLMNPQQFFTQLYQQSTSENPNKSYEEYLDRREAEISDRMTELEETRAMTVASASSNVKRYLKSQEGIEVEKPDVIRTPTGYYPADSYDEVLQQPKEMDLQESIKPPQAEAQEFQQKLEALEAQKETLQKQKEALEKEREKSEKDRQKDIQPPTEEGLFKRKEKIVLPGRRRLRIIGEEKKEEKKEEEAEEKQKEEEKQKAEEIQEAQKDYETKIEEIRVLRDTLNNNEKALERLNTFVSKLSRLDGSNTISPTYINTVLGFIENNFGTDLSSKRQTDKKPFSRQKSLEYAKSNLTYFENLFDKLRKDLLDNVDDLQNEINKIDEFRKKYNLKKKVRF